MPISRRLLFHADLNFLGKISIDKVIKVGSTLLTSFALLTQALAPAEAAWEGEMVHLRSEVADNAEQLLKLQSDIAAISGAISGGVTCNP